MCKEKFCVQKDFMYSLFAISLLLGIPFVSNLNKDLLGFENGNVILFGDLQVLLALGLLFRSKIAWVITEILCFICLILIVLGTLKVEGSVVFPNLVLIASLLFLFVLLLSKPVRIYLNRE